MKRIIVVILAVLMLMTAIPLTGFVGFEIGTKAEAASFKVGDHIQFGNYPQSQVTNSALIKKLDSAKKTWKSYGYYSGKSTWNNPSQYGTMKSSDYMKYSDFFCSGTKYRAVVFSAYRPMETINKSDSDYSLQDENGFVKNKTYYFKFEPLTWRVLNPAIGFVMCERAIDSQAFQNLVFYKSNEFWANKTAKTYASNYTNSSIRKWLNSDFFKTAFTDGQKKNIKVTTVDNSMTADPLYWEETTDDKIFLLSTTDYEASNGFSRDDYGNVCEIVKETSYARCQGIRPGYVGTEDFAGFVFGCPCWFRNPFDSGSVCVIDAEGYIDPLSNVDNTYIGVRPACCLKTLKNDISIDNEVTVSTPVGLTVTATNTTALNLTWNKVSGATGYVVYQYNASTKKYTKLGSTKATTYKAKNLQPGTTYRFVVKAYKTVDGKNYYSDYSKELKTTTDKAYGLAVYLSRATATYYEGENIFISVRLENDRKVKRPKNLKVISSNQKAVKSEYFKEGSYSYVGDLKPYPTLKDKQTTLKQVITFSLPALKEGETTISVSCDDVSTPVQFQLSVLKDKLKLFRADNFKKTYFKNADSYVAIGNGLFVKDFKCTKNGNSYSVKMDVWNRLACYGALEVYNAKGKLIYVDMIDKWDGVPTSLKENAIAYWHIVSDAYRSIKGVPQFQWKTCSEKTSLEFTLPKGGYFKVTNDAAQSLCCYMYNMMDLYLDSFFLTKDVIDTVDPSPDIKQDKKATEALIKKSVKSFILKETKQNIVKEYMKKLSKDSGVEFTLSMASDYLGKITGIADEFFKKIDIHPIDLLKGASKAVTSIAESCFTQWLGVGAPAMTKAIKAVLNLNSGINIFYQIKAFLFETYNKNIALLLYAPATATLPSPSNLIVTTANITALNLLWSPVDGATSYVVYQYNASAKKYTKLGSTKTNTYKVKNLKSGTTYQFAVRAYGTISGKTVHSGYSNIVKATTKKS